MTASLPPSFNQPGYTGRYSATSAYHRPASKMSWSQANSQLEEAVQSGKLTQAQANQILAHIAQRHR